MQEGFITSKTYKVLKLAKYDHCPKFRFITSKTYKVLKPQKGFFCKFSI